MADQNIAEEALESIGEVCQTVNNSIEPLMTSFREDVGFSLDQLRFEAQASPDDERDWLAQSKYPGELTLPVELDLREWLREPRNQGDKGSCASMVGACIKEYHEHRDCGYDRYMSPEFIYYHRSNKPQAGMYGRDVMAILLKHGCCTEKLFPYQADGVVDELPAKAEEEAANYKISAYVKINSVEEMKTTLYKDGPCYIAFAIYNNLPKFWTKRQENDQPLGGHAVTVVGYNKEGFIIRNSWGPKWNGDGCIIYPYDEFGAHYEAYGTFDVKNSPNPDHSPTFPAPKKKKSRCLIS